MFRASSIPCLVLTVVALLTFGTESGIGQNCRVTTTARFLNQHNRPVSDVTIDQIKAEIGGSPAKLIAIAPSPKPILVLLLDDSSSAKGTWIQSIAAAKQIADSAGEQIALGVFRLNLQAFAKGAIPHRETPE